MTNSLFTSGALQGRVAVITGGTRGIGRGIADAFLAAGATVMISGKSADKGKQALAEMGVGDRAGFVTERAETFRAWRSFLTSIGCSTPSRAADSGQRRSWRSGSPSRIP